VPRTFLAELTGDRAAQIPDLAGLNRLFTAWTETVYHVREHSEARQAPLARWEAGMAALLAAGAAVYDEDSVVVPPAGNSLTPADDAA